MRGGFNRIRRIYPELSTEQRVIISVVNRSTGAEDDPDLRAKMTAGERAEYDRRLRTLALAEFIFRASLHLVKERLATLGARYGIAATLRAWQLRSSVFEYVLFGQLRQPITSTDYAVKVAEARAEWAPVRFLAELACEHREGNTVVELERELIQLASDGILPSRGKKRRLELRQGDFDDWLGRSTEIHPEWPRTFEVFADDAKAGMEQRLELLETVRESMFDESYATMESSLIEAVGHGLQEVRANLLAFAAVLAEVSDAFAGHEAFSQALLEEYEACVSAGNQLSGQLVELGWNELPVVVDEEFANLMRARLKGLIVIQAQSRDRAKPAS